jgi:type I restriction enzyme S subunit
MTVERVSVGDVLSLERRPAAVSLDEMYEEIGIRSFGRGVFHKEPVSGGDLGSKRVFWIEPRDLLLSNVFAWEGAVAVAGQGERGKIGSHRFMTYTPVDDRIDTTWASWYFRSEPGLELIRQASPGSAGRNRTLAIDRFRAIEIPLPPIDEQRRVVERLNRIARASEQLASRLSQSARLASAVPLAVHAQLEATGKWSLTKLGDVLELVRTSVVIDPCVEYVTLGVRSFGRGVFHYPRRPGNQIGKLRFQSVAPDLLVISNIKAWEGAVATTGQSDEPTVASNRFLFYRPVAGEEATDFFWALLLGSQGLAALGQASPGSADRNRTLAMDRFREISLPIPPPKDQVILGKKIRAAREGIAQFERRSESLAERIAALVPAALNDAFGNL